MAPRPARRLMRISQRQFGAVRIVDLHGPFVGLAAAEQVDQVVGPLARSTSLLVVNLSRATELDEDVLCVLGETSRVLRQHGGTLRVALPRRQQPRRSTRRLEAFFECFESVEDAVADVRASMDRSWSRLVTARLRRAWTGWWRVSLL